MSGVQRYTWGSIGMRASKDNALADRNYQLRMSPGPSAGEFGDAYQGVREDLAIWKRRALEAESKVREQDQIIDHLTLEAQGETRFGEPALSNCVVDERAAFEAFDYSDRCFRLRREGQCYVYATTERELIAFRAGVAWQASLNPCRAQAVPDGYVLVPVDPTPEMLDRYPFNVSAATSEPMDKEDLRVVYQAMIAAAPSAKKESGQ